MRVGRKENATHHLGRFLLFFRNTTLGGGGGGGRTAGRAEVFGVFPTVETHARRGEVLAERKDGTRAEHLCVRAAVDGAEEK